MSAQCGKVNFDGTPVDPKDLVEVRPVLAPYGPDGEGYICKDNFGILYRAYHTTKESRLEKQPYVLPSGRLVCWDGRLDNREELVSQLEGRVSNGSTDLEIVSSAYERWGTDAFAKVIGDWAVSIWDPSKRSLILAKDVAGIRQLFYSTDKDQVTWCTILDPLILLARRSFAVEEEYIAGWLAFFPATYLTPYVGIHAVPHSSYVLIQPGRHVLRKYWDFDSHKTIRYKADDEYEQHFRSVFTEAVRRRLRADSPVLAELSGGMDSSSIVCVADTILNRGLAESPRLDTVSYYNDTEPNWDERPYFTKVEEKRGRIGYHINTSAPEVTKTDVCTDRLLALPALINYDRSSRQLATCMLQNANRVVLSGIGGDEVTGGVPTPVPELADSLANGSIGSLARQLKTWALNKRRPWPYLLREVVGRFISASSTNDRSSTAWIREEFVARNRLAFQGYQSRLKLFGPAPSHQLNREALDSVLRQIACHSFQPDLLQERRYPYLDRDLLEFLFAVPPQQLVRPGQRRSLMRRALNWIVPPEVLGRRRKAYIARSLAAGVPAQWSSLTARNKRLTTESMGVVDSAKLFETLQRARDGQEVPAVTLRRTLHLELWVRNVIRHRVVDPELFDPQGLCESLHGCECGPHGAPAHQGFS